MLIITYVECIRAKEELHSKEDEAAAAFAREMAMDEELTKHRKASITGKKRKKKIPELLPGRFSEFLPQTKNCFDFFEVAESRVRVFYSTPSGYRMTSSASLTKYGKKEAILKVLKWAWLRHTDFTSEECPHEWIFAET